VHRSAAVEAGQVLVTLDQPDLDFACAGSEANARSYEARLSGLLADPAGLTEDAATRQRLNVQLEEMWPRAMRSLA
jgi:putative peptide zinc metalloprotease protein